MERDVTGTGIRERLRMRVNMRLCPEGENHDLPSNLPLPAVWRDVLITVPCIPADSPPDKDGERTCCLAASMVELVSSM